jgi:serine/threonine-protein kinase
MGINIGETIGDYQVLRALGAGGMGAIFEVRHLISDRAEAMKVLLPNLEENRDLAERFLREIRLQASLSHPGIATLHTALRHNNQLLMIMEYVEGESLDILLRRKGIDLATAVDILIQLLNALAYAHSRGVIHRDIKPANVMLVAGTRVKLVDFGIARPFSDSRLTQTGFAIGSLHYMSPEQLRGLSIDGRTDLYSAAVMLYEMTTGTRPFSGEDPYAIMKAQMEQEPAPPESLNSLISRPLSLIMSRALCKEPARRFQRAEEFAEALEAVRATLAHALTPVRNNSSPSSTTAPKSSSSKPAVTLFEPDSIERLTHALAIAIGPMAKVLVSRAAKTAASWDDLYRTLAAEVPPGPERDKFLAARWSIVLRRQ